MSLPAGRCALVAFCSLLAACSRCDDGDPPADAGPDVEASAPPSVRGLQWRDEPTARGYGVPSGCRLISPIRSATIEPETTWVAAPTTTREIVLWPSDGRSPARVVQLEAGTAIAMAWPQREDALAIARAESGWIAAWDAPAGDSRSAMVAGRDGPKAIGTGDQLRVADVSCTGDHCALLTTLARRTLSPGATLWTRSGTEWSNVDFEPEGDEPWSPLSIVRSSPARSVIALEREGAVAIWTANQGSNPTSRVVDAPHGVLDVVEGSAGAVVVRAGRDLDECTTDQFPLEVVTPKKAFALNAQANPSGMVSAPLRRESAIGTALAWVAPLRCRTQGASLVHAAVLDAEGRPASSVMAVARADGVALAASGAEMHLWLRVEGRLVWIRADCASLRSREAGDSASEANPGPPTPQR